MNNRIKSEAAPLALSSDALQNALILIAHHVRDAKHGCEQGDAGYVKRSLDDISEVVQDLKDALPLAKRAEVDRALQH